MRVFTFESLLYLFLFSGGEFIFVGWSLWSCFRLYLGASLCILPFLALATFVLPCWDIHVRGSIFFLCFLFQTAYRPMFMSSSLIYVFIVCCLKSRFYFICLYFFHTCGYAFCLSVSGNIQVDSIKLLSTLATDG